MPAKKRGRHWYADFYLRTGAGYERVRERPIVNTKKAAEDLETRIKVAASAPKLKDVADSPLFADFAVDFMDTYAIQNRLSEQQAKASTLDLHLLPHFGGKRLAEITNHDVDTYVAGKRAEREGEKPLSPKTINNHLTILRKMLSTAIDWKKLDRAPVIRLLRVPRQRFDFLTPEEADALVDGADDGAWRVAILVGLKAGLRVGEIMGLQWRDVDTRKGELHVERAVARGVLGPTKSGKPRDVPIAPTLLVALKALPRRLDCPFVFHNDGKMLERGQTKWPLYRAAERAKIRRVGWHVLRHSFASHLAMAGLPMRTLQEWMGHSTIAMTERYSHLSPRTNHDAIALLDARSDGHQTVKGDADR